MSETLKQQPRVVVQGEVRLKVGQHGQVTLNDSSVLRGANGGLFMPGAVTGWDPNASEGFVQSDEAKWEGRPLSPVDLVTLARAPRQDRGSKNRPGFFSRIFQRKS